ncbi:MAG: imm11 family protein [Armatimonadota bacterium]
MKYYKLSYDFSHDRDAVYLHIINETLKFDRYCTDEGKQFDSWDENITFTYDTEDGYVVTDYIADNLMWFTISEKFRLLLEEYASESVQFLPIKVKPLRDDIGLEICYLANITTVIDALDLEHSIYYYDGEGEDKQLSVQIYKLKESAISGVNIFRLKNSEVPIFISGKLEKAMVEAGITGCSYRAIQTFK